MKAKHCRLAAELDSRYARPMGPNRRDQDRLRAAERTAAAEAREIISKAERAAGRKARRRRALVRDAVIAGVVAIILAAIWKPLGLLLTAVAVP